jgi:PAS domain S-box-containing protein
MERTEENRKNPAEEIEHLRKRLESSQQAMRNLELLLENSTRELEKVKQELNENIAEQIVLRNECQVNTERYHALIQHIPGVVYRCANDSTWTMEFISDQIEALSGYPADEFRRNKVRSFASIIHNDDMFIVAEAVQRSLRSRKPYVIEYRIKHANGSIRWVYEKGQGVFDNGGEFLYLDGVIFDITDRVPGGGKSYWRLDSGNDD